MRLTLTTREKILAGLLATRLQIMVDCLAGLLGDLELHGATGLLLADGCPIQSVAMGCNIIDLQVHNIAAAKLAIYRQIKKSEIANTPIKLKLCADGPNVLCL